MDEIERCCVDTLPGDRYGSFHPHQCSRNGIVTRNGKVYCKIHDPEAIEAKRAIERAAYDRGWKIKSLERDLASVVGLMIEKIVTFPLRPVDPSLLARYLETKIAIEKTKAEGRVK